MKEACHQLPQNCPCDYMRASLKSICGRNICKDQNARHRIGPLAITRGVLAIHGCHVHWNLAHPGLRVSMHVQTLIQIRFSHLRPRNEPFEIARISQGPPGVLRGRRSGKNIPHCESHYHTKIETIQDPKYWSFIVGTTLRLLLYLRLG